MQLRQGPSGPPIVGTTVGDVLTWNGSEWLPQQPESAYALQREWFLDAAGDDSGPGTESDPLRTGAELSRRISNLTLPDQTEVTYLSDMAGSDYLIGPSAIAPGCRFVVQCPDLTLLAEVTITAYQQGAAGTITRCRVTVAGQPNWWAALIGKHFSVVGVANSGGYLDKGDPADNTSAFISMPVNTLSFAEIVLVAGNVLRFTERRTIGCALVLAPRLSSSFGANEVHDVKVVEHPTNFDGAVHLSNVSQVYNCEFQPFSIVANYYSYIINCNLSSPTTQSYFDCTMWNTLVGGFQRGRQFWGGSGTLELNKFTNSDTRVEVHQQLEYDVSGVCAFWDFPTGPAIEIEPACFLNHRARMYGSSTAANTYGFSFNTGSFGHISNGQNANNRPNIRGTLGTGGSGTLTRDLNIGGTNVFYAVGATVLPYLNPTNACGFVTRVAT